MDDLSELCATNLDGRRREAHKVDQIVDEEVARYLRWSETREVAPTIAALASASGITPEPRPSRPP